MYFPDLTMYRYLNQVELTNVLNVGWLDKDAPFPVGDVPVGFLDRLKLWMGKARVNQSRGLYECNICKPVQWPLLPLDQHPRLDVGEGKGILMGHWEVWIPSLSKKIYAAPALIYHYVELHRYRPPDEYVASVMSSDKFKGWDADIEFKTATESVGTAAMPQKEE
jgi:hypothetical protein